MKDFLSLDDVPAMVRPKEPEFVPPLTIADFRLEEFDWKDPVFQR